MPGSIPQECCGPFDSRGRCDHGTTSVGQRTLVSSSSVEVAISPVSVSAESVHPPFLSLGRTLASALLRVRSGLAVTEYRWPVISYGDVEVDEKTEILKFGPMSLNQN